MAYRLQTEEKEQDQELSLVGHHFALFENRIWLFFQWYIVVGQWGKTVSSLLSYY